MSRARNAPEGVDVRFDGLLERPLAARSVIGSLLLGVHPPRLPGARIVEWCTRFGIAEGTVHAQLHGARRKLVAGLERYYPFGQDSGEGAMS